MNAASTCPCLSSLFLSNLGRLLTVFAAIGLAAAFLVASPAQGWADQDNTPETSPKSVDALPWYVPSHAKLQYAGNIGWLSAGAGYTYLDDILQSELFFGYVPALTGNQRLAMTTFKQIAIPYEFGWGQHLRVVPIYAGAFATYTFGDDYYVFAPEHLEGVYSRQTALRFGPLVGGRIGADIEPFGPIESVGAYWELNANDLAINAYVKNPEFFNVYDILALGLGVELGFK
jgi:hypothetical protein